ncbi:MAG TPA: hypothetical protein VE420_05660 [Gemmatimonadales bacterium]|nr:hypothetical protein [Gemmatimonadales bacterium]
MIDEARCHARSGTHRHAGPLIAPTQPRHDWNAQQHHPGFADDLWQQELKAPKCQEQGVGAGIVNFADYSL